MQQQRQRAEAEAAVDDLAAGGVQDALEDRLDAINDPITVPPVNDADANGVEDTAAERAATALVEEAEAAQKLQKSCSPNFRKMA